MLVDGLKRFRLVPQTLLWLMAFAITALLSGKAAHAQFSDGAITVTVPSPGAGSSAAPRKTPKATPPKQVEKRTKRVRRRTARRSAPRKSASTAADKLKIAVLVNDDPITMYEIDQRAALLAGSSGLRAKAQANFQAMIKRKSTNERLRAILKRTIDEHRDRGRQHVMAVFERRKRAFALAMQKSAVQQARQSVLPGLRRKATEELIDERLKLQAASNAKVQVSKAQLDNVMKGIASRNKLSMKAFEDQLRRQGTDIYAMRSRIKAQISWQRLISAKFGRLVDVSQKTIDEAIGGGSNAEKVSLHLKRLVFKLPNNINQKIVAQRMVDAEKVRGQFTGCENIRQIAFGTKEVVFQDLGYMVATSVPEPTRTLLLNSADGSMVPPVTSREGIELYAVCARRSGVKSFAARDAAERNLRNNQAEIYGRKYLSDLRRDAHIERRL